VLDILTAGLAAGAPNPGLLLKPLEAVAGIGVVPQLGAGVKLALGAVALNPG
jgi:hypothetical protein